MNPLAAEEPPEADAGSGARVVGLLADYLLTAGHSAWPGTDGLTVAEAVGAFYRSAALSGEVPGLADLARRHPDLADALTSFLGTECRPGSAPAETHTG